MEGVTGWIEKDRSTSSRNADLERLKEIDAQLKGVVREIKEMGPKGTLALKAVTDFIAPLVSASWINHQFPDDDWGSEQISYYCGHGHGSTKTPAAAPA